jgi:hypothetical protein
MSRILGVVFVVVLVIVVAIGIGIYYSANIVQQIVERAGMHVLRVDVRLREVDLTDVMDGTVGAHGLRVGNPAGFHSDYAMDVGHISATVDPASLRADVLVIREIVIDAPRIIYEYTDGRSNIGEIQGHVNAFVDARRPDEPQPAEGRPLIIENLRIRDAEATVLATHLGREARVAIPPVHLTDLGTETGGITPAEVVARVYAELHRQVGGAVAGLGLPDVSEHAAQARREADAAAAAVRDRAREAAERLREDVEERTDGAARDIEERIRRRFE